MTILIVEDELIEQQALTKMLQQLYPDKKLDIHYATDGTTAVSLACSLDVQIILLDIQLPVFNGLEVARRIRSSNESIEIVIITAYSKFEYAQQALKSNIFDYVVKPYSLKTIRSVMDSLYERIEQKQRKIRQIEENQKLRSILQREFLQKLYLGFDFTNPQIAEYAEYLDFASCAYLLCLHVVESPAQTPLAKYLHSLQASYGIGCYSESFQNHTIHLLFSEQQEQLYCVRSRLEEKRLAGTVSLGEIKTDWNMVSREYKTLLARIPSELQYKKASDLIVFKMTDAILSKNEKQLIELALQIPVPEAGGERELRRLFLSLVLKVIAQVYSISEVQASGLYQEIGYSILQEEGGGMQQARHELTTCLRFFLDNFHTKLTNNNQRSISLVKHRISEQYAQALSLELLASEIGLSPSYLSRLFKSQEGVNLKDYILSIRVDKAKQCLLEGRNVEQASFETGFSDPAYFTKCFKKAVGLTPREYVQEKKRLS